MVTNANNNSNALNINRGPVKNFNTPLNIDTQIPDSNNSLSLITATVKTEMKSEESDNKSQYEENVVQPLTPLESYSTNEDKLADINEIETTKAIPLEEDVEDAINKLQQVNTSSHTTPGHLLNASTIEEYDLTTPTPPLINPNPMNGSGSSQQQSLVGRRARIGKSMAWEMVYAGAVNANAVSPALQPTYPTSHQSAMNTSPNTTSASNHNLCLKRTSQFISNISPTHNNYSTQMGNETSSKNINNSPSRMLSKGDTAVIAAPLILKAEIKSEKIKLEDELLDKVLQQQTTTMPQQHLSPSPQIHINQEKSELKIIKAEPITLNEILHESKVKLEADSGLEKFPSVEKDSSDIDSVKNSSSNKPVGRMRLLPSWQQPTISNLPIINCDIDLSHTSDDEILDLCHSPVVPSTVSICNGKRIKILEYSKSQCKKSPPNSYKSLIKQTVPKTYLCLSRKVDKKSRYGKLQNKSAKTSSCNSTIRRRELILTDQQKKRLRVRKKKLAALERQKREAREMKRAECKQKRKEPKLDSNKCDSRTDEQIKIEQETIIVDLVADEDEVERKANNYSERILLLPTQELVRQPVLEKSNNMLDNLPIKASPKRGKPTKKTVVPLHLIETIDAVARGYFSEPETRCSLTISSPIHTNFLQSHEKSDPTSTTTTKKLKSSKTSTEKRSKSETKKPIKSILKSAADIKSSDALIKPVLEIQAPKNKTIQMLITSKQLEAGHVLENEKNNNAAVQQSCEEALVGSKVSKSSKSRVTKCKKEPKSKRQSEPNCKKSKPSKDAKSTKVNMENTLTSNQLENEKERSECVAANLEQRPTDETNNNEYNKTVVLHTEVPVKIASSLELLDTENSNDDQQSSISDIFLRETDQAIKSQQHSLNTLTPVFLQPPLPPLPRIVCHSHHHQQHTGKRNRSRSKFGSRKRQKLKHSTVSFELDETLPPAPRSDVVPKWNNGWTWEGEPFQGAVFLNVTFDIEF